MNHLSRNLLLWLFLALMVGLLYNVMREPHQGATEIPYSDFRSAVKEGRVSEVVIKEGEIKGQYKFKADAKEKSEFLTKLPPQSDQDLVKTLLEAGVRVEAKPKEEDSWYLVILANWGPMLLLIAVWIFFMRQVQVGGGKALSFGKSRARMLEEGPGKITFEDVAGIEECKHELQSIVQFLKDPKKFTKLGGRIPKGVLLAGSPGTGKTLLAKAIAGEAGVPFFSISGSDFVEMFVGVGASRVRDLFLRAKKNAPCIVFIDEIDAVGRHRGAGLGGGHDEREQTLNQLLVEMDGFETNEGVILVAATNRPDVLDPALLRPGRFDRTVVVPLPDVRGREAILKVHTKKVPLASDVDLAKIARGTPGFAGADLANLINESALYAAANDAEHVSMKDIEFAKDKILMGSERRSMAMTEKEKRITAYHEAGHALVAKLCPHADPVHKVTIVPRGVALGLMQQLPEGDRYHYTKEYYLDWICVCFGGRAAEEIVFNEISSGASSDITQATRTARRMVCEWGMSDRLGPLAYGKRDEAVFLGREITSTRDYSEETANLIDEEIRRLIEEQLNRSRTFLRANRVKLDALATRLLEEETLDAEQVSKILAGARGGSSGGSSESGNGNDDSTVDLKPITEGAPIGNA
ncbi:ATP-dependent zinc metalloprotease FtsH [bacterium]|nr:ATP-dependent zinc metalloprotease FtsH [bacterium]